MKLNITKWILGVTLLYGLLMAHNTIATDPLTPAWVKAIPIFAGCVLILWMFRQILVPAIASIITIPLNLLGNLLSFLVFGLNRWHGARYMNIWEIWRFFGGHGWLVDGRSRRLSEKVSYQSVVTVAGMGAGKTTTFVIPNIFTLSDCSLVVSDTSGELYEQTSGYLKRKGFEIRVLNLMEMTRSNGFNPLEQATSFTEVAQLAHLLIRSSPSTGGKDDQFWNAGAEKIIRILIQCLKNRGVAEDCTLARVKQLLSEFDHFRAPAGASQLDNWVMESTLHDPTTWQEYKSFISGNEKAVNSFITTADVALMALGNPELASLTQSGGIDFGELRQRKVALYVMARQQDMSSFAFLLNAFYTQLFNELLRELNPKLLSVYLLLDEFGQLYLPNFSTVSTTARKYRVAFWIFLQSLGQLEGRYSKAEAQTILDGLRTEIYLAGTGLETAERLSRRLGRKRPRHQKDKVNYVDSSLMNPDEVITMRDNEALLLHGNKRPFRYSVTPFYRNGTYRRRARMKPAELPHLEKSEPTPNTASRNASAASCDDEHSHSNEASNTENIDE